MGRRALGGGFRVGHTVRGSNRSAQIFHGGFILLLLILPLMRGAWDRWAQSLVLLTWATLGGLGSLRLFLRRPRSEASTASLGTAGPPLLLFLTVGAVSALWSAFPSSAGPAVLADVAAAAFFFLAAGLTPSLWGLYVRAFAGATALPVAAALAGGTATPGSLAGPLVNSNVLAGLILLGLPAVVFLGVGTETGPRAEPATRGAPEALMRPRERWVWRAGAVLSVSGLLLTGSFVGFLALGMEAAAVGALFIGSRNGGPGLAAWVSARNRKTAVWGTALLAAALAGGAFLFQAEWPKLWQGEPDRLSWWKTALAMVRSSPVLGIGPGAFGEGYPAFRFNEWGLNSLYAHNFLLEISAERGFLGAGAFLAFLGLAARQGFREERRLARAVAVGLGGFLLFNTAHIGFSFPGLTWLFFAGAGLLWGGRNRPPTPSPSTAVRRRWGLAGLLFWGALGGIALAVFRSDQFKARAVVAFEAEDLSRAREYAERGLWWNRWNPELYDLRAALRLMDKDPAGAARDMDRCVALAPAGAGFRRDAAELAYRRGDRKEALAHYDIAVRLLPLNPFPWVRRGDLLEEEKDRSGAEASYRNALRALADVRVFGGDARAREALAGQVRERIGRLGNAVKS